MDELENLTNSGYNSNVNNKQRTKKNRNRQNIDTFKKSSIIASLPSNPGGNYLIPEIDIKDYFYCTIRLYKLLENDTKKYTSNDDIFMKAIFLSQTHSDESTWNQFNEQRKFQNALSQRLGDFHEQIAGKLPGYRTLPESHWSGLDVMKNDRTEFFEWKNSTNVSTDTLAIVYKKFQKLLDENKTEKCILVLVNVPEGWKAPLPIKKTKDGTIVVDLTGPKYKDKVFIVSGREAYAVM
jgi:hypothetical protein